MRLIKIFGLISILVILFFYFIGCFAAASFNIAEWSSMNRGFIAFWMVVFSVGITITIEVMRFESEAEKKRNSN